jgi:hypothetical protein
MAPDRSVHQRGRRPLTGSARQNAFRRIAGRRHNSLAPKHRYMTTRSARAGNEIAASHKPISIQAIEPEINPKPTILVERLVADGV